MDNHGHSLILNEDDDLAEVLEELHGAEAKWKSIGIHLKLPLSCLEEIGREHKGDTEECSLQMQIAWLRSKKATWKSLVEALRKSSVGYEDKARDIEKKKLSSSNTGRRKDSQSQSQPPVDVFLTEHLEWLLKIGCSVDKILKWAREKQQNQAVEIETPSLSFNSHNSIDTSSSILHSPGGNSSGHSSAKTKKRKRQQQQSDKSQKPRPKKSRKRSNSPIRFILINTLQGTERERQLQVKHNMLQIIKKLKRDPDGAEFINFVDKGQAKGYYDIIMYPMCLKEIEDRINKHHCDSREVFCEEFDSIVENCVKYNGADSPITEKVQRLKVKFYELVQTYLTTDTSASVSCEHPPLAEVEEEQLSSEHSNSDEEYNPVAELQSTFDYDMKVGDLSKPSQAEELPQDWKEKNDGDTTARRPAREMSEFESSVKVKDMYDHDPAGGSTQMDSADEVSDSELPSINWK